MFRYDRLLAYLSPVLMLSCAAPGPASKAGDEKPLEHPRMMEFKMANYEGARLAYSLEGRRADLLERQETALIDAPLLKIYQQETQGKLLAEARGASGTLDLATKNIVLEGSVVYHVIPREQRLNTSKLIYRTAEHEMEVPEGTGYTLRTPQGTVDGSGLVAKEDLTQ